MPRFSRKKSAFCIFSLALLHTHFIFSWVSIGHRFGGGLGYDSGFTSLDTFFYADNSDFIVPFVDLGVHYFDNNEWAANGGLGVRFAPGGRHAFGINGYFDYFTSNGRDVGYTQAGAGLELLGDWFDIRANGYFPIKKSHKIATCEQFFPGGYFVRRDRYRRAMSGADVEVGMFYNSRPQNAGFYGALGGYSYIGKNMKSISGGRLRLAVFYTEYASFEGIATHDNVFGTRIQGGIAIYFPLGRFSPSTYGSDRKGYRRVFRNPIIVLDDTCCWDYNF